MHHERDGTQGARGGRRDVSGAVGDVRKGICGFGRRGDGVAERRRAMPHVEGARDAATLAGRPAVDAGGGRVGGQRAGRIEVSDGRVGARWGASAPGKRAPHSSGPKHLAWSAHTPQEGAGQT